MPDLGLQGLPLLTHLSFYSISLLLSFPQLGVLAYHVMSTFIIHTFSAITHLLFRDAPVLQRLEVLLHSPLERYPGHSTDHDFIVAALVGDKVHYLDLIYKFDQVTSQFYEQYTSGAAQAAYLRANRPELVPLPVGGAPPSTHLVSSHFEYHYATSVVFRIEYLASLV